MDFNLITNIEACHVSVPALLYYSHLPAALISLMVGAYVFFKNRNNISAKFLFFISIVFSVWTTFDLLTWATQTSYNSMIIMLLWGIMNLLEPLLFLLFLYFAYTFIYKKYPPFAFNFLSSISLIPLLILLPTKINLQNFNNADCEAVQGKLIEYVYFLDVLFSICVLVILIRAIVVAKIDQRKQIGFLSIGILLFLVAFSWANIIGNVTTNWEITQYGLFGMPIFIGFLAYLIVKYKAFSIKLLGAQALVAALVILIASEFAFIQNNTNKILTAITLALAIGFGYVLIKSVKQEVERKEQLQLMADKLAVANDELRMLDNAKTEFISIASHQLRTPLTAVKGYASLVLDGSYGEISTQVKDAVDKIYMSEERLAGLVEELLNVSRIESGRMQYELKPEDIGVVMKEIYENLILMAKNKGLYLEMKVAEGLPQINADLKKFKEVVSNLTENAIKYTDNGGVTMSAELKEQADQKHNESAIAGKALRFMVTDTGIGIPAEEIPYLFKKFSRGKDVKRLHADGTGLGLYVVKNIVEAHKGNIWIESDGAGKGTRFIVELPVLG
jgi:signal transduction histidine kinase